MRASWSAKKMLLSRCKKSINPFKISGLSFVCKYNTRYAKVKLCDIPHVCSSEKWNSVIQESQTILQKHSTVFTSRNQARCVVSTQNVIKRLQESSQHNYLMETFRQLLANTETTTSELRWPGLVTLMLAKGVGNTFNADNFISKSLEDIIWSSQITLAEIVNLLYCKLIFQKECYRVASSRSLASLRNVYREIERLVSHYFTSSVFCKAATLKNEKVLFLIARALESLTKAKHDERPQFYLIHNLHDWEHEILYPQGLLLANGCQSTLELAGYDEESQQLAFEFGRYFTLAIKANGDLQQLWNYERSHSSLINILSFPVVLHLSRYPEMLEYIYSCRENLDNLDYHTLHASLMLNSGTEEAKQQLSTYVQRACCILEGFENVKNEEMRQSLLKLVQTLENISQD